MSFIYSLTDTWNAVGTTFNSIQMDASNGVGGAPVGSAASRLLNLKNNGTSVFAVDVNGNLTTASNMLTNNEVAIAGTSNITNAYKGQTIGLSGAFYTVTLAAVAGYDANYQVKFSNKSTTRGKEIVVTGAPYDTTFILWPLQTCIVYNSNGAWQIDGPGRWVIPSNLGGTINMYMDSTLGADTNDGLAAGAGGALLTLDGAAFTVCLTQWDLSNSHVVCNLADGTYVKGLHLPGPFIGASGGDNFRFKGNTVSPGNVLISTTGEDCFGTFYDVHIVLQGMKLTCTGANCITAERGSEIRLFGSVIFGDAAGAQICAQNGGRVFIDGNYSIAAGTCNFHILSVSGGLVIATNTWTITWIGNTAYVLAVAYCSTQSLISMSNSTITLGVFNNVGTRYTALGVSFLNTGSGNANYFPGTIAGSVSLGGQYL